MFFQSDNHTTTTYHTTNTTTTTNSTTMNHTTSPAPSVYGDANSVFSYGVDPRRPDSRLSHAASWTSVETTSDMPEAHPRYVAPHARPINLEMGDVTQIASRDPAKPDEQGVGNRLFQKLMVYVHFALTKAMILQLTARFPGMFFQSVDHRNHDHPIAHVVTQVGTRLLQRMIRPCARVLDVYGNPSAAESFNRSQARGRTPKVMDTIVNVKCPSDFIRAVNKWPLDYANAVGQHFVGDVDDMLPQDLAQYSVFTMIHTLYYLKVEQVYRLIRSSPGSRVLALIHRHDKPHGFLNNSEQEYWVRNGIVKQRNVASNTCYFHSDVTPFWFGETKHHVCEPTTGAGVAWEAHFICEDTWVIEIVAYDGAAVRCDAGDDFEAIFEGLNTNLCADPLVDPLVAEVPKAAEPTPVTVLTDSDGRAVPLTVCSLPLFQALRRQAVGKPRSGPAGRKLYDSLLSSAKHLTAPGVLFPDAEPISCKPEHLVDHVLSAMATDVVREYDLFTAMRDLAPLLCDHTRVVTGSRSLGPNSFSSWSEAGKSLVMLAKQGNLIRRSADPVGSALNGLDAAISERID
jgi:hypothetical protein